MNIEIAMDNDYAEEFKSWLISKGHDAEVGTSTGNYIDGVSCDSNEDADEAMNNLWVQFCNEA